MQRLANVVEKLDNEEEEINFEEGDFTNTNNMIGIDKVQFISFLEAPRGTQSQSQLEWSSKKKRKSANSRETYEALKELSYVIAGVIKKASIRLSKAIGEDI